MVEWSITAHHISSNNVFHRQRAPGYQSTLMTFHIMNHISNEVQKRNTHYYIYIAQSKHSRRYSHGTLSSYGGFSRVKYVLNYIYVIKNHKEQKNREKSGCTSNASRSCYYGCLPTHKHDQQEHTADTRKIMQSALNKCKQCTTQSHMINPKLKRSE